MSTLTKTITSDANITGPLSLTINSDATVTGPMTLTTTSDAFITPPFINITSDAFIVALTPPPPPPPPFVPQNTRFCANKITCSGTDSPIINVSAETDDGPSFFAQRWPSIDPSQLPNPIMQTFTASNCYGTVTSNISQADADQQAERNAFLCQHTNPTTGQVFGNVSGNSPQTATVNCPDGTPFTFTVPAGTFFAINQFQANAQAKSYAQQQAVARLLCIGNLPTGYAVGTQVNQPVTATGNLSPFPYSDEWSLIGDLPDGLTFNGGFINAQEVAAGVEDGPSITGIPTTNGSFTFSIQITNWIGDFQIKQFTFNVTGVSFTITPSITSGAITYFNNGASIAAGNYTVKYLKGGFIPDSRYGFCVNAQFTSPAFFTHYLITYGGGAQTFAGPSPTPPFYPTQAACEAANAGASNTITHSGGPIGMNLVDGLYSDNVAGSPNPQFQLVSA